MNFYFHFVTACALACAGAGSAAQQVANAPTSCNNAFEGAGDNPLIDERGARGTSDNAHIVCPLDLDANAHPNTLKVTVRGNVLRYFDNVLGRIQTGRVTCELHSLTYAGVHRMHPGFSVNTPGKFERTIEVSRNALPSDAFANLVCGLSGNGGGRVYGYQISGS
jgi:hypothetical protein